MYQTEEINGVTYRVDDEGNYYDSQGTLVSPNISLDPAYTPIKKDNSWARRPNHNLDLTGGSKSGGFNNSFGPAIPARQYESGVVHKPLPKQRNPVQLDRIGVEGKTWDGKPYERNPWKPDISLNENNLPRGIFGAKDDQGRRTHRGFLGGILSGADELFNDPKRMALIAGGLRMADPNSYYDKQGFYSPWGGINAGLGTGIKTYKDLSAPKKLGFEAQEAIKHKNALELEDRKALGKDSFTAMFKNFKKAQEDGYEGTFYEYQVDLKKAGKTSVTVNTGEQKMTKGREASDKAVGQMYAEYIARGGYGDALKNLSQLKVAHERLEGVATGESDDNLTGPLLGMVPDFIKSFYNPKSIDTRELVEEVVQRNLKLILGAQFTEREGERLIARAYNPNLDEATNARRLGRLVKAMEIAMQARNDSFTFFEDNGTLLGWKGKTPTMDDFMRAVGDAPTDPGDTDLPEGYEEVK